MSLFCVLCVFKFTAISELELKHEFDMSWHFRNVSFCHLLCSVTTLSSLISCIGRAVNISWPLLHVCVRARARAHTHTHTHTLEITGSMCYLWELVCRWYSQEGRNLVKCQTHVDGKCSKFSTCGKGFLQRVTLWLTSEQTQVKIKTFELWNLCKISLRWKKSCDPSKNMHPLMKAVSNV